MMHLFAVGSYDEVLIVAERVVSIQAEPKIDRAGQQVAPPIYDKAVFEGSIISLDNGTSIPVPQSPKAVAERMAAAINRRTVMDRVTDE